MGGKFILNADDFGVSKAANSAVAEAYEYGFLKSASLNPNGEAFDEAADVIIPKCPELGVGVHLNLTSGTSVCSDLDLLTDANRKFCNSYLQLFVKAYSPKNEEFLQQVEREFRRQIEKVMAKAKVYHIDSHSHIHSIPPIFNIVCRLAKEYNIPHVRTHFEKFYFVPDLYKHFNKRYYLNILKKFMLNLLTIFNENTINNYRLETNDYIIGIGYASQMDALAISYGMKAIKQGNSTIEVSLHPHRYDDGIIDTYFDEYMITRNQKLSDKISRLGYDITNYIREDSDK